MFFHDICFNFVSGSVSPSQTVEGMTLHLAIYNMQATVMLHD